MRFWRKKEQRNQWGEPRYRTLEDGTELTLAKVGVAVWIEGHITPDEADARVAAFAQDAMEYAGSPFVLNPEAQALVGRYKQAKFEDWEGFFDSSPDKRLPEYR